MTRCQLGLAVGRMHCRHTLCVASTPRQHARRLPHAGPPRDQMLLPNAEVARQLIANSFCSCLCCPINHTSVALCAKTVFPPAQSQPQIMPL